MGNQFLEAVSMIVESIAANPESFPVVYRQTRRASTSFCNFTDSFAIWH
jgi:hypothetical protein